MLCNPTSIIFPAVLYPVCLQSEVKIQYFQSNIYYKCNKCVMLMHQLFKNILSLSKTKIYCTTLFCIYVWLNVY